MYGYGYECKHGDLLACRKRSPDPTRGDKTRLRYQGVVHEERENRFSWEDQKRSKTLKSPSHLDKEIAMSPPIPGLAKSKAELQGPEVDKHVLLVSSAPDTLMVAMAVASGACLSS